MMMHRGQSPALLALTLGVSLLLSSSAMAEYSSISESYKYNNEKYHSTSKTPYSNTSSMSKTTYGSQYGPNNSYTKSSKSYTSSTTYSNRTVERPYNTIHQPSSTPTVAPQFTLVKQFEGQDEFSILHPAFSGDGRYVAANLNEAKSIRIWDMQTGQMLSEIGPETLYGTMELVDGIEFTPDSQHIIVFRSGHPLKEINWKTQTVVRTMNLNMTGPKIEDYAFSPDYKWLVLAGSDGVYIWNYQLGEQVGHLLDGEYIYSIDISSDGQRLAFGKRGSIDYSVGVINLDTKQIESYPLAKLSPSERQSLPPYQVRHVAFDPTQSGLIVGYMELPEGLVQPMGPAGVFQVDLVSYQITGPQPLTSTMISQDPVYLKAPFNTTFFNTFEFGSRGSLSAADFFTTDLHRVRTLTSAEFNAPMLDYRFTPNQQYMVGSFREPDGKARLRLYEISPEGSGYPGSSVKTNYGSTYSSPYQRY